MKSAVAALCMALGLNVGSYATPNSTPCPGGLCDAAALAPFFDVLERAHAGFGPQVHILQIGDSHSANDNFAGAWRAILQARLGDGGRGVMPPGRPYAGYVTREVTVAQSPGWSSENTLEASHAGHTELFGLSGYRTTAMVPGADMSISADAGRSFARFVVCAETSPSAGEITLSIGDQRTTVDLRSANIGARCTELRSNTPQVRAAVAAPEGRVTLLSWATFQNGPGVVVSNLGVVGAELHHFLPDGDAAAEAELGAYAPDLIVIAYGTNDGFTSHVSSVAYGEKLRGAIRRVRRLAPGVPILLLGAPDAQTRNAALRANADTVAPTPAAADGWFSPPGLQEIRIAQRRIAASEQVALWEWADRMGGVGVARMWATAQPPMMRPDHVHFTVSGGARLAALLQADLDAARQTRPSSIE